MAPSPSLVASAGRATILTPDGEILSMPAEEAQAALRTLPIPLVVHAPATFRRLGLRTTPPALDLLELFAFVHPGRLAAPTPRGLAMALDMKPPKSLDDAASLLPDIADALLAHLRAAKDVPMNAHAAGIAARMGRARWPWARPVMEALGSADPSLDGFKPWRRLPEWEDLAPPPPPSSHPVPPAEARARLANILGPGAEQRPGQADYAHAAAAAFGPREMRGDPHLVLAEAGTGHGEKPWATSRQPACGPSGTMVRSGSARSQNISSARSMPNLPGCTRTRPSAAAAWCVRKGRENYLCLLNLEDAINMALSGPGANLIALGLIARWAAATHDGDLFGGDLPGWFAELFGTGTTAAIADRRGECIHGACTHYKKCFIEHTVRRARSADLVVANHALVMTQAAWGGIDDDNVPTRYVFDEGHHLFEAADSAFASEISGAEGADLRRWLLGAEGSTSRARGLKRRLDELVVGNAELEAPLDAILLAARALPAAGWPQRLTDEAGAHGANPFEVFIHAARTQILARITGGIGQDQRGTLEVELFPANPDLLDAAPILARALARIATPVNTLLERLEDRLDDDAEELDSTTRGRIDAAIRGLRRRALDRLTIWQAMLDKLDAPRAEPGDRPVHIHFLRLDRRDGVDRDVAYCRHHLDPTLPFATTLAGPAHGVLVTSATLRDAGAGEAEADWEAAEARVGASHLPSPAYRASLGSPFDYAQQTRAFVVTDVSTDMTALAGAYRALFMAAGGGALGLFTAIGRLKAVHARIAAALDDAGIPLFAQHVDPMDNATLVDIFRTEENSCLLGTDAMRDGVDVPGRALRLVVFERVPWPRPDILHRERRIHLSGGDPTGYDDRIARLRLRQAFGRLIRRAGDRGVFVLLDRRAPSRLLSAFPQGVEVRRAGLAETVAETSAFLKSSAISFQSSE